MYRVVYCGVEPFAEIATNAFAGCFRVAQCSVDAFGEYSEPFLLEPMASEADTLSCTVDAGQVKATVMPAGDSTSRVRKLRSLPAASPAVDMDDVGCSMALQASNARLQQLLRSVYADCEHSRDLFGFPHDDVVELTNMLEARKGKFHAANREVALLLFVLHRVKGRARRARVRTSWYELCVSRLALACERLVPEVDCYSVEFFASVTTALHKLAFETFRILLKVSSNGWLRQ
ncbi:hypothetical protein FI667_g136, partial [Globisporangium splendens]